MISRAFLSTLLAAIMLAPGGLRAEVMLQYFNTSWTEITYKMPELAEAGYTALWLPPPTKGSGGLSVGYDLWDPFDLGDKDQRNTVRTRYGTKGELLRLIETAHRFGLRVYFDNIMNHRAFDIPGFNENTPIDIYPGLVPEDFHLRVTPEGFYRKWDNTRNWGDEWQVMNLGLADLIDIAQEPGSTNFNFGPSEGSTAQKIKFLRDPQRPDYYCYKPGGSSSSHADGNGEYVGFGPDNGITTQFLLDHREYYSEYVQDYLNRAARWLINETKADGLRLDAVKHVRSDFFGAAGAGADSSNYGYTGEIQRQFNLTRGYSDWDNHRDSTFNDLIARDDALIFGEHLGAPPGYGQYMNRGMRLVDAPLHREMNNRLGHPWGSLAGLDSAGWSGDPDFNQFTGVAFAQSHDDDYSSRRELQHAYYILKQGISNVYTDGYYKAEVLGQSGGAFPRHANNPFLGQFGDNRLPNLLSIHEQFARGEQIGKWGDNDVLAFERRDKRENAGMSDADGTVLLFMMNDNYSMGHGRSIQTTWPATPGGTDTYLYNYSSYGGGFYKWASEIAQGQVVIPPGGYFAFSWKNPDPSGLWSGSPVTIYQGDEQAGTLTYARRDGPDGDAGFNPKNLANRGYPVGVTPKPFTYLATVPRVTAAEDLRFVVRADGSAENVMLKLNGGADVNSHLGLGPQAGDLRDHPPALSTDTWLGYEQMAFKHRQHPEKFASAFSQDNQIGSLGAGTYHKVIGTAGFTVVDGPKNANATYNTFGGNVASFIWHNPVSEVGGPSEVEEVGSPQYSEDGAHITIWAKTNSVGAGFRMFLYYTTDGTNPEGAGGEGVGTTKTAVMSFQHNDDGGATDWWGSATVPKPAGGLELRYKIGIFKDSQAGLPVGSIFPSGPENVAAKANMMTVFEIDGFNAGTAAHRPHNDYGQSVSGLPDGFHVLRGRAFLDRSGRASIYNTFTQPFYLDAERPGGEIAFPATNGETVGGQEYGAVVRTDATVTEVWYNILDGDAGNDDISTGTLNGIGDGFEPYTDLNQNGQRDGGEPFEDINGDEVWNANIGPSWVRATSVTPSTAISPSDPDFIKEWRFNYRHIPSTGTADIRVRLVELSSTARADWEAGTADEEAQFTTLTRTVQTRGPDIRFFTAWPRQDGDQVGPDYVAKVHFTKSLANGLTEVQLLERFLVRIQSGESGRTEGGTPLNREEYEILYNETADFHALAFALPNLFNGDPAWQHGLEVTFTRPGEADLTTSRLVTAFPVPPPPSVEIVSPVEVGSDGRPFEIILPEKAAPTAEERQFIVRVATAVEATNVSLALEFGAEGYAGTFTLRPSSVEDPNPMVEGTTKFWDFIWSDLVPGQYRFVATVTEGGETNTASRNSRVLFRQLVEFDESGDSDNDGIPDDLEGEQEPLPATNPDTWTNGQVHAWFFSGKTNPLSPNSDGGGLPDGLQLGLIGPIVPAATDLAADTSGDGFPNFIPDLDPPLFNTNGNPGYQQTQSRTNQLRGSMTSPSKPDTDDDGLRDAEEDLNRNGRVDIGILNASGRVASVLVHPNLPTIPNTSRVDRNALPEGAVLLETDPNSPDSGGGGLLDGQADLNRNGRVDMVLLHQNGTEVPVDYDNTASPFFQYNRMPVDPTILEWDNHNRPAWMPNHTDYDFQSIRSRAVHYGMLRADYEADGTGEEQSDGWPKLLILETDPLVLDTVGSGLPDGWKVRYGLDPLDDGVYNWRTGEPGDPRNGPNGDLTGDGITNLQHFQNGTDPRSVITFTEPPADSITVGPGQRLGNINGLDYYEEFAGWTADDLIVLDEYDGDGPNNQGGDIFPGGDGFDGSRDLVAFYAREGADSIFFRVDLHDLKAFAENGFLNIYVAINPNPGVGERALPDEVDTLTDMRWRAVVAVYDSAAGRVYVDTDPVNNTNNFGENLFSGKGVVVYDQAHPKGFKGAYFNSELDAVEFSISRDALIDAGWVGSNFNDLKFQVFTVKDGNGNSPQGGGDLGGRSDLRDTIYDDRVVEHHYFSQAGREDILKGWFSRGGSNDNGRSAKVMLVLEGNQALLPGHEVQNSLNTGAGAGWYRALATHELFDAPVALQITPTLASALQWASVDPAVNKPWRDGPAFNDQISAFASSGHLELLGTTFSGHPLPYTPIAFDADNIGLASEMLDSIYGVAPSSDVLWAPERVMDGAVLNKIAQLGFSHTFIDQRQHLQRWFGRQIALGNDGYRINRINGVDTFVITEDVGGLRFQNHDSGASMSFRQLLSRKARSGQQDQAITLLMSLDDFADKAKADAYERTVRWLVNRPWVELVRPGQLANDPDWGVINRGADPDLPMEAKDFIQYATRGTYDNWYYGEAEREGLEPKIFNSRPGVALPSPYGQIGVSGTSHQAWVAVEEIPTNDEDLAELGLLSRGALHAAKFVAGFHNQSNVDLRKFSTGEYINPATGFESLAGFSKIAQAQIRHAAVYRRVSQWAAAAGAGQVTGTQTAFEDIDLDGESEHLLFNAQLFALFERLGGRMTGAWIRATDGAVIQVAGNFLSYAGVEDETEGTVHDIGGTQTGAHRTSGFKDWFAQTGAVGEGTSAYVNDLFAVAAVAGGWQFTSADGKVVKTITLPADTRNLQAQYALTDIAKLYVRFGLSPDLLGLLVYGQQFLAPLEEQGNSVQVTHATPERLTRAILTSGANTTLNFSATDKPVAFDTVPLRNQAQTQQVELEGTGTFAFTLSFESEADPFFDTDDDGLPDWWEELYFGGPTGADPSLDFDGDRLTNLQEFLFGTHPKQADGYQAGMERLPNGNFQIAIPTIPNRVYQVLYSDDLVTWQEAGDAIAGTGGVVTWEDAGDLGAIPPRPASSAAADRFYRVLVALPPE